MDGPIPASQKLTANRREWKRIRLAEWAASEGISRITAYRMLQRGVLPVPYERSPTGRWYVLVPTQRIGRVAIYTLADPGPKQLEQLNEQSNSLAQWVVSKHWDIFTSVSEIGRYPRDPLPRLERLLLDRDITFILIDNPGVLIPNLYRLLTAALTPQGRSIIVAHPNQAPDPAP